MKKVFIIAGELSGDRTAAWYIQKQKQQMLDCHWVGVGGDLMEQEGVVLVERLEYLNLVGVFEVIRHLPRIIKFMHRLVAYLVTEKFDEVVLVDFPGFNLRFAGLLKKKLPWLTITYVAPPQLWCWGAWRARKIKKLCTSIIVVYPFEVAWYKQQAIEARWLGCPVYDTLKPYIQVNVTKQPVIALIPGSREGEFQRFLPFLVQVAGVLYKKYPQIRFVIPVAASLSEDFIAQNIEYSRVAINKLPLDFVKDDSKKYTQLGSCCLAITKPGTVTLELALLKVPAIVFFKISWVTYFLGRCVVKVTHMALPNLLLNKLVYPECIQQHCTVDEIVKHADSVLESFLGNRIFYQSCEDELALLRSMLQRK